MFRPEPSINALLHWEEREIRADCKILDQTSAQSFENINPIVTSELANQRPHDPSKVQFGGENINLNRGAASPDRPSVQILEINGNLLKAKHAFYFRLSHKSSTDPIEIVVNYHHSRQADEYKCISILVVFQNNPHSDAVALPDCKLTALFLVQSSTPPKSETHCVRTTIVVKEPHNVMIAQGFGLLHSIAREDRPNHKCNACFHIFSQRVHIVARPPLCLDRTPPTDNAVNEGTVNNNDCTQDKQMSVFGEQQRFSDHCACSATISAPFRTIAAPRAAPRSANTSRKSLRNIVSFASTLLRLVVLLLSASPLAAQTTCAPGWVDYSYKCYKFDYVYSPFASCLGYCQGLRADATMLCIENSAQNSFVTGHLVGEAWVGYTDVVSEGTFVWGAGCGSQYTHWYAGEPNNMGDEDFTKISFDGDWVDIPDISTGIMCACEYIGGPTAAPSPAPTVNPTPVSITTCAQGWITFGSKCYKFDLGIINYASCVSYCPSLITGATMLCIENSAQNTFIASNLYWESWVGYTDQVVEGNFVWVAGCGSQFTSWNSGEPNNSGNEDFTTVNFGGGWVDIADSNSIGCACEYIGGPTVAPSPTPTVNPTAQPSRPTTPPTLMPTTNPTAAPSTVPTVTPSAIPTSQPSSQPSRQPSARPTCQPSSQPSISPSAQPSRQPSAQPSRRPSYQPSGQPSAQPSFAPSAQPTAQPSRQPSVAPFTQPSDQPSAQPSGVPSAQPSSQPSIQPSRMPTEQPSGQPSSQPSVLPSTQPSSQPSAQPSGLPSTQPSSQPSSQPSNVPSAQPSSQPSVQPSSQPSCQPSTQPSSQPSSQPSNIPSAQPSSQPSVQPSSQPSCQPSTPPSSQPSSQPSTIPSVQPSNRPSLQPSSVPSDQPTRQPSSQPSGVPSTQPTAVPTGQPSTQPSSCPSTQPSSQPSSRPSTQPSEQPTLQPSSQPSSLPSGLPTSLPTNQPSSQPSSLPTAQPSAQPSSLPSVQPSSVPSGQPTCQPSRQPSSRPSTTYADPLAPVVAANASITTVRPLKQSVEVLVTVDGRSNVIVYCAAFRTSIAGTHVLTSLSDIHRMDSTGVLVSPAKSATITVSSLLPYTEYSVYCTAVALQGDETSLAVVRNGATTFKTLCCKTISFSLLATDVTEGSALQKGVSVSFDSLPSASVSLLFMFSTRAKTATSVYPSTVTLTNTSGSATQYLTLIAGDIGPHTLEVVLSGPSAVEYSVTNEGSQMISVLSSNTEPSTPRVLSATFTNDGSAVVLTFNAPTDKGGYFNTFPCAKLLNFSGNAAASCQWSDSAKMIIYPVYTIKAPTQVLSIGSDIVVYADKIRAACTSTETNSCRSWATVPYTEVQVAAPLAPVQSVVVLSVPATLGGCSSLTVDLTSSTGAAGRPWNTTQFKVKVLTAQGASPGAVRLERYLANNFTLSPPCVIPSSVIVKDLTYTIQATLCNFLGGCSSAVKSVTVLSSVSAVPVVTILGQSQRSVYRSSQLVLNSNAYTQSCSGAVSSASLEYTWIISRLLSNGTLIATALRSSSQSPTVFKLPAYTLDASTQYQATLSVKSVASGLSASATVALSVLQGKVVASVQGGATTKQLKVNETVQLDASQSYDEDVSGARGEAAGLSFLWTCVQTKPVFSATCALQTPVVMSTAKLSARAPLAALNTTSLFTVTALSGSRSSSAQVMIVVAGASAPKLSITSTLTSLFNINTGKQLVLYGSLELQVPCSAAWGVDDKGLSISELSMTPVTKYVSPSAGSSVPFNLILSENSLPQRATLVFSLTCGTTSTSVSVTTNGAPLPGEFSVMPPSGDELSTVFTLTATQWADADLPLTYQFGFLSATSLSNLIIQSKSEISYALTTLPSSNQDQTSAVTCTLQVFDSVGASTSIQSTVTVELVSSNQRAESLLALIQANTGSVDSTKNILSVVSSALNSVNCTAAPNCTSLNRSPCQKTSGECGSCLSGYIGEAGDRSTLCVAAQDSSEGQAEQRCSTAEDCPLSWQVCDTATATCVSPPKSCSQNCSSHGECIFVNSVSGNLQVGCRLDDSSCEAVCSCADQYFGTFCEVDAETLMSRRELRSNLIDSLYNLTSIEDINAESVSAWSASLYSLSINPQELSTRDIATVASIANMTVRSALQLEVDSYMDIEGVLQATDSIASLQKYNYNPNDYRSQDFNSTAVYVNNTAAAVVHTVSAFGDLVARSMVLGQNSTTLLYDNFRLSVQLNVVSVAAGGITALSPQTSTEQGIGTDASSVDLVPSSASTQSQTVAVKLVAVYPRSYSPDTTAFVSSPLMLQVQAQDSDSGDSASPDEYLSNVEFTFQHNELQYQYLHSDAVNFTTVCTKRNESEQRSFACPESGHVLIHNCSQGAGVHTSYCPKPAPGCAKLGVDSVDITAFDGCKVVSYNLTYTVCSCPVAAQRRHRRYLATTEEQQLLDDSGAANMMVSTVFIANDFADTFSAADDFNSAEDAKRVLVVIIMLGVLWVPALLFLGYGWLPPSAPKAVKPAEGQNPTVDTQAQKSVMAYIESTIPEVFHSEKSGWARLWSELITHHDLFRFFGKESQEQRQLLVGKTVTMMTFMFFLTAAFFDVSNPGDDGSCPDHATEESCLKRTCPFDYDQTYCQWSDDVSDGAAPCTYASQSMSITALIYLTVLTTVLTAIATIPLDYLFSILSAPTAKSITGSTVMKVLQTAVEGARRLTQRRSTVRPTGVDRTASAKSAALTAPAESKVNKPAGASAHSSEPVPVVDDTLIVSREVPMEVVKASAAARASIAVIAKNSKAIKQRRGNVNMSRLTVQPEESFPTAQPQHPSAGAAGERGSSVQTRTVERASTAGSTRSSASALVSAPAHGRSLSTLPLCCDVIDQRMRMSDGADETLTYDADWGVIRSTSEQGSSVYRLSEEALVAINEDVLAARAESRALCEVLPHYNEHHAGLEILHLFMMDLLGRNTLAAKIFQEKFGEDFGRSQVVGIYQKYAAAILLLCLNAFFAYYILLKAFQKGYEWQIQFLVCIIVQIAVDMMIFETSECVWLNYSVPQFVNQEVVAAARKLTAHVDSLAATSELQVMEEGVSEPTYVVNAPAHLFVSAHVARKYPELMESMIVSSYTSPLPGEICRTWPHNTALSEQEGRLSREQRRVSWHPSTWVYLGPALIASIALTEKMFITIPYLYQRVIIRFVQPILFSGICLLWYIAIRTILSAIIVGVLSGICILYFLWRRYKAHQADQLAMNTVAPAAKPTDKAPGRDPATTQAPARVDNVVNMKSADVESALDSWATKCQPDEHRPTSPGGSIVSFTSVHSSVHSFGAACGDGTVVEAFGDEGTHTSDGEPQEPEAAPSGAGMRSADGIYDTADTDSPGTPVETVLPSPASLTDQRTADAYRDRAASVVRRAIAISSSGTHSNITKLPLQAPQEAAVSEAPPEDAVCTYEALVEEFHESDADVPQPAGDIAGDGEPINVADASVTAAAVQGTNDTTPDGGDNDSENELLSVDESFLIGGSSVMEEGSLVQPSTSSRMSAVRAYGTKPLKITNMSTRSGKFEAAPVKRSPSAKVSAARDKKVQLLKSIYSMG